MKKIVIVGASSGMGLIVAATFARMGWRVGMAARRLEPMQAVKEQYPANVAIQQLDVTAPDAVKNFHSLIENIDGMDVMLYCAGVGFSNDDLDQAHTTATLETNVVGFTKIVNAAYKYFKDTANVMQGQIAAITSVGGIKGIGIAAAYSASKRYQWNYLQAIDQLAHQQHVNVLITDIRPGFVDTPLLDTSKHTYPMMMQPAYAAAKVVNAILKRRHRAYIDSRWAIVSGLWHLIPSPLWRHIGFVAW